MGVLGGSDGGSVVIFADGAESGAGGRAHVMTLWMMLLIVVVLMVTVLNTCRCC
jgi:hypothetical protein